MDKLDLYGYDLPCVAGDIRYPATLEIHDHEERDEVSFWIRSEDGNTVVYLSPEEILRLGEWIDDYRKDFL